MGRMAFNMTKDTAQPTTRQHLRDRIDPKALPVKCPTCGHINHKPCLSQSPAGIWADCHRCGRFMKFLRQKTKFASGGFVTTIKEWLPRLTRADKLKIRNAIDKELGEV